MGTLTTLIATPVAILLGIMAGYLGGRVDDLIQYIYTTLSSIPSILLIAFLATLGFAAVGTLFSAMAVNTRSREIMLPLLLLPVVAPVIIAAVEASQAILSGTPFGELARWWQLLLAFDVIFLVVSSVLFGIVLEE